MKQVIRVRPDKELASKLNQFAEDDYGDQDTDDIEKYESDSLVLTAMQQKLTAVGDEQSQKLLAKIV